MKLPVHDWQFWVVTALAGAALLFIVRNLVPARWWRRKPRGKAASLTIEGRSVEKKK